MKFSTIFKAVAVVVVLVGGYFLFKGHKTSQTNNSSQSQQQSSNSNMNNNSNSSSTTSDSVVAVIDTNMGSFEVTLDAKAAPQTVANFVKLANEGFCDGTKFHRIIMDFVIQGCDPNSKTGDPSTWGQGGPGYTVPAEIGLKANVGAIAMARQGDQVNPTRASSGSQFFIVTTESVANHTALDGMYTVFGYVTSGMDIVTKIAAVPVEPNAFGEPSQPVNPVIINSITIKN